METRDRWMASLQYPEGGLEFLVADLQSWTPGQAVRVAFLGGRRTPREDRGGHQPDRGGGEPHAGLPRRRRLPHVDHEDTEYAAEIRVSFDQGGYFSLVGTDSVNPNIGLPQHRSAALRTSGA